MVRKLFLLLLALSSQAFSQEFPNRPIAIVAPFPAGSISDVVARIAAERMAKSLGQPVVVENRPGLNGAIGAAQVTRATPDGYTLLLGTNGILFINPLLFRDLPYDPKDLAPLALAAEVPAVLVARSGLEAKTLREAIALAKQKPGALSIASGQATAQVATEALLGFALPNGWTGFFAPAGTPAAIRARLAKDILAALEAPESRQRIEASVGTLVSIENPEQLAARIQRESAAWAKLIKAAKVDLK